jgi:hypothetical protein
MTPNAAVRIAVSAANEDRSGHTDERSREEAEESAVRIAVSAANEDRSGHTDERSREEAGI